MDRHERILEAMRLSDMDSLRPLLSQVVLERHAYSMNYYYMEAIRTIKPAIVRMIHNLYSIDPNYSDENARKLLHHAAEIGIYDAVKFLIARGAVVNISDVNGFSPLHLSSSAGHADVVELLLKEGAQRNRVRSLLLGEAPLHSASEHGHYDCVKVLLDNGARVDVLSQDEHLCTPLHKSIQSRHFEISKLLVQRGASLLITDSKGYSALHLAVIQSGAVEFVEFLYGTDVEKLNSKGKKGRTALHLAVSGKCKEMAQAMVNLFSADLSTPDKDGNSALHLAAMHGNNDFVDLLIEAGANLECRAQTGETPISTAVSCARVETVRRLLLAGADVNTQDYRGVTPFHRAQIIPPPARMETMELLMEHGARLNVHDHRGYTPLDRCVINSVLAHFDREAFQLMVSAGCSIRPQLDDCSMDCPNRNSPLCWLVWKGDLESARFLVYSGCDLSRENWFTIPGKNRDQERLLEWLRQFSREPRTLMHESRSVIRSRLSKCCTDREIMTPISRLPLPSLLKRFLEFQGEKELLN